MSDTDIPSPLDDAHDYTLGGTFTEIGVDLCRPNPWNPNQMKDKEFDRLVREIEDSGMIDPIQVVPLQDDGHTYYRIIGGEHRWNACKVLGRALVPAIVLTDPKWADEDRQKFVTMRLNTIKGSLNREKLSALVLDVSQRHHDGEIPDLFGYTDKDKWDKLVADTKASVKSAGLPAAAEKELSAELDKLDGEIKTVDSLSKIVHKIMNKYGSTVDKNFIFFEHGGKKHVMLQVSEETFALAELVMGLVDGKMTVDKLLVPLLKDVLAKAQG